MRIIFTGSAEFACPALELLLKTGRDEIAGVVSQPERPSGRHQKNKKCPVDEFASARSLPVLNPENINTPENVETLRALKPDLVIIVAYGQILKAGVLGLAPKGCVNLHGSLLPKYRGAAPIQWAVANGEEKTGVTTMFINEKMDAGDIIAQEEELITPDDTAVSLGRRLAGKGAKLLLETVEMIRRGNAQRTKQNEALATYAPRLKKTDGLIDWTRPAKELSDRIRGFQPWPCCYFLLSDKSNVRVFQARVEAGGSALPGTVLETCGEGPLIQAGAGALRLLELQPEGRKPMSGNAFLCGKKISAGLNL
jgi:methionyl-tRNA formyltransferase